MRLAILSLALLSGFVLASAPAARADIVEDCEQDTDPNLIIDGCTAIIDSGEWEGKDLAWAYSRRGVVYANLGEYARAIEDFDAAIRLDPKNADTYFVRGLIHKLLGDFDRAARDWERGIEIQGVSVISTLQNRLKDAGHFTGAVDGVYDDGTWTALLACARDPECAPLPGLMTPTVVTQAMEDCGQGIDLDLKIDSCTALIRSSVMTGEVLATTYYFRGAAWLRRKEYARAVEDLNQAIHLNPEDALAYDQRGVAHIRLGNSEQAVRDWEQSISIKGAHEVSLWQTLLKRRGHYTGMIDGVYSPETRAALIACARDPDLTQPYC